MTRPPPNSPPFPSTTLFRSGDFVRNRLFQPFASTKDDGFGIGSFEARPLVAAMGGRLSVDTRPGHGTIFTIQPAARSEEHTPELQSRPSFVCPLLLAKTTYP